MSLSKVKSALVKAFVDANFFAKVNTSFENVKFTPGASPWAKLTFIPANPVVATLGAGGSDRYDGIFQIDLNYPLDTGDEATNTKFEEIRNFFTAGRRYAYSGQEVIVSNCGRSQGRIIGGYFKTTVSVFFFAHVNR